MDRTWPAQCAGGKCSQTTNSNQGEPMTLTVAIAINVVAMFALIGVLSYAMTRAARLKPHLASIELPAPAAAQPRRAPASRPARPRGPLLASVRSYI
jgi:hypothetical protein